MKLIIIKSIGRLAFTFLISTCAFSQGIYREGFYLNQKGDTVRGTIKISGNEQDPKFQFKAAGQSVASDISATEADAVVISNYRYFKSIAINNERKFAQALVEGVAGLYSWNDQFFLLKDGQLSRLEVEKTQVTDNNGAVVIQNKKTYIGTLKAAMADCPAVWPDIDQARLVEGSLTSLVEKYNSCKNGNSTVYKKNLPSFKVSVSPLIAWSYSRINTKSDQSSTGSFAYLRGADLSDISISPGIGFHFFNPGMNSRISFYTELRYVKNFYYDRYLYSGTTFDDNEITLNVSQLFLPLTGRYDFPLNAKSSIYLKVGLITTFLLNGELTINRTVSIAPPNSPPLEVLDDFQFYSVQIWFAGAAGYQFGMSEKLDAWFEVRYESPGALLNDAQVGMPQNVLSLVTAISF